MWVPYSIQIHTVHEHKYYDKVKGEGEVASWLEDKLTEY